MSRFNLWEKVIKEELEDEVMVGPEDETDELEDKIEDEKEDTLYDMSVNFILSLPEDSIPEDMRVVYDELMSKIGDEYLGGEEETDNEDLDELDEPKFDDEEMKESKDRGSYGVVLPSGTKIQVNDGAEQKRAKKAVDAYVKVNPGAGDKALMKLAAMAILMKGELIKDVIKAYDAVTGDKFKDYVSAMK